MQHDADCAFGASDHAGPCTPWSAPAAKPYKCAADHDHDSVGEAALCNLDAAEPRPRCGLGVIALELGYPDDEDCERCGRPFGAHREPEEGEA